MNAESNDGLRRLNHCLTLILAEHADKEAITPAVPEIKVDEVLHPEQSVEDWANEAIEPDSVESDDFKQDWPEISQSQVSIEFTACSKELSHKYAEFARDQEFLFGKAPLAARPQRIPIT